MTKELHLTQAHIFRLDHGSPSDSILLKNTVKDRSWLAVAEVFAEIRSKDPRTKVGAVLVSVGELYTSLGYNGLGRGVPDTEENWSSPRKHSLVIHAEINALDKANFDKNGATIYCTHKPCNDCMNRIANAGIVRVAYIDAPTNRTDYYEPEIRGIVTARIEEIVRYGVE